MHAATRAKLARRRSAAKAPVTRADELHLAEQAASEGVLSAFTVAGIAAEMQRQRQYRLYMEGTANVKEWGAKGDGVTDDTEAVQAAIAAVVNNPAGAHPAACDSGDRVVLETPSRCICQRQWIE